MRALRRGLGTRVGVRAHASCSHANGTDRAASELFENNEQWVQAELERDPKVFQRWSSPQKPRYLWIGCADSRVSAERICGLPPGPARERMKYRREDCSIVCRGVVCG